MIGGKNRSSYCSGWREGFGKLPRGRVGGNFGTCTCIYLVLCSAAVVEVLCGADGFCSLSRWNKKAKGLEIQRPVVGSFQQSGVF